MQGGIERKLETENREPKDYAINSKHGAQAPLFWTGESVTRSNRYMSYQYAIAGSLARVALLTDISNNNR